MKKCPYCAEEIITEAVKCRYCGKWLDKKGLTTVEKEHHSEVVSGESSQTSGPLDVIYTAQDANHDTVSKEHEHRHAKERTHEGLGGWLILVGIGVIISPLRIIAEMSPMYSKIFSDGTWAALTTPGTEVYNPLWAPMLSGEIVINGALILVWAFIAFLFFLKKRLFPKWYIGILIFNLCFIVVDALAVKSILPNEAVLDPDTTKSVTSLLIQSLIWVPYMLVSKRVKATFVK